MKNHDELKVMREKLHERLVKETYRITAHNDEKLAKIAGIQAGIAAIDYVLENGIEAPAAVKEPGAAVVETGFF